MMRLLGYSLYSTARAGGRARSKARASILCAVALAIGVGAAQAANAVRASTPVASHRWSGYVVTGTRVSFSSVTGTWTEPAVSCVHGTHALSTVWVGLGGYSADLGQLEQVGTDANCDASGHATYFAWFELLPDIARNIDGKIFAGDTITGSVRVLDLNLVELRLTNRTRHWTFARKIRSGSSNTASAEWIVEAPYSCLRFSCNQAPLANFGSVSIRSISAIGNRSPGTLTTRGWTTTPLVLASCVQTAAGESRERANATRSQPGAAPRQFSSDGSSFAVSWVRETPAATTCKPSGGTAGILPDYTSG